jgi:hypothetical protein
MMGAMPTIQKDSGLFVIDGYTNTFKDQEWLLKIIILGLAALVIWIPILNFFVLGYGVRLAQNINRGMRGLPKWDDWGGDFVRGASLFGGMLIFAIPFGIIQGIIWVGGTAAFTETQCYDNSYYSSYYDRWVYDSYCYEDMSDEGAIAIVLGTVVVNIISALITPQVVTQFVAYGSFGGFFQFSSMFQRFGTGQTLNAIGSIILLYIIANITIYLGAVFFFFPGLLALGAAVACYSFIIGRYAESTKGKVTMPPPKPVMQPMMQPAGMAPAPYAQPYMPPSQSMGTPPPQSTLWHALPAGQSSKPESALSSQSTLFVMNKPFTAIPNSKIPCTGGSHESPLS